MQSLNSKNYVAVAVKLRDQDEPIIMNVANGTRLMDYLVSDHNATHVGITDQEGNKSVVKVTDIQRVEPMQKMAEVADYV